MRKIRAIIPISFRSKLTWIVIASIFRALLNFIGVAAVLPILLLILTPDDLLSYPLISKIFHGLGFTSISMFIVGICLLVVVVFLLKNSLNILLVRFQNIHLINLFHYYSNTLFIEYHHRGLSFLKQNNSVILAHQINGVCHSFVFNVLSAIISAISDVLLVVMLWTAMLVYNPIISLMLSVVFFPIGLIYIYIVKNKLKESGRQENLIRRQQNRLLQESFKGYTEVKIYDAFPSLLKRFNSNLQLLKKYRLKNELISMFSSFLIEIALVIGLIILVLMNLYAKEATLSLLFGVFAVAALRMLPAFRSLLNKWMQIKYNQYTIEVVYEGVKTNSTKKENSSQARLTFDKEIKVEAISYAFPDADTTFLIKNLSMTIQKGDCIGIRGASGIGKTTFFHLLMGFYTPTEGNIWIDDVLLNEETEQMWQNIIAYVSQDVFVMDATLAQNIALSLDDEQIDREKIKKVLEVVQLHTLLSNLSEGIDTNLRESANRLSGGEKQRIGIARALYKEAKVLFFDEATSALDLKTEQEIQQTIRNIAEYDKSLTILMIAHRESSLSCCNRIINIGE